MNGEVPMNETHEHRAVLTTREVRGWACPDCDYFVYAVEGNDYYAKRVAGQHCAPSTCDRCGLEHDNRPYIKCRNCIAELKRERWEQAERVEVDSNTLIYSEVWDSFYTGVDDYLDNVVYKNDDLGEDDKPYTPASGRPYVCEFVRARVPDLAEAIADELPDDDHGGDVIPDWLKELQAHVRAEFDKHKPGAWWPGKKVPAGLPESLD